MVRIGGLRSSSEGGGWANAPRRLLTLAAHHAAINHQGSGMAQESSYAHKAEEV